MNNIEEIVDKVLFVGGFKTKKKLAEWLGIDPSAINQWVKSKNIPTNHLKKIEEILSATNSPTSLHVNTITATKLSPKMDELVRWFSVLDKDDQKRIYNEIKALADKKLDLSHL